MFTIYNSLYIFIVIIIVKQLQHEVIFAILQCREVLTRRRHQDRLQGQEGGTGHPGGSLGWTDSAQPITDRTQKDIL